MLVLVNAYQRRALELIKYQQIISREIAKFKGLAWIGYRVTSSSVARRPMTCP